MYKIICIKEIRFVKSFLINWFERLDILTPQSLLRAVNYMILSARYKNKKINISINQLFNQKIFQNVSTWL